MKPKTIALSVAAVLLLILIVQNTGAVTFRFFFWKLSMSMIIFFPITLLFGALLGYLAAGLLGHPKR